MSYANVIQSCLGRLLVGLSVLTVAVSSALSATFSNPSSITIADAGAGTPYPSTLNVSGLSGNISLVTVTLSNLNHSYAGDIDILLVSPTGQKVMIFSDAGGAVALNNTTLTFADSAAGTLPSAGSITSGTYKPVDHDSGDTLGGSAPAGPYANTLSTFNGQAANGTWSLYVWDDGAGDSGSVSGGWILNITATPVVPPPTISNIADQITATGTATPAIAFTIGDPDTAAANLALSGTSSDTTLVPNANIAFGGSGSNRTVRVTPATGRTGSAIITVNVSDGTTTVSDTFVLTVFTPIPGTTANVSWNRNSETNISSYRVYYGPAPGQYTNSVSAGTATNAAINNLRAGVVYYMAVTAINTSSLESDPSNEIIVSPAQTNNAPVLTVPGQVVAQLQTTTAITGVQITDPDGTNQNMRLNLSAARGVVRVSTSISGGVTAAQVTGNASKAVVVTATLGALQRTLAGANGLTYTGDLNLVGNDSLVVAVTETAQTSNTDTETIAVQVQGTTLDAWRNQYFTSTQLTNPANATTIYGDNADPDLDGTDNLLEFALGLNPTASESTDSALQMSTATSGGQQYATLTFRRRKNQTLIQYVPEVSSDKAAWFSGAAYLVQTSVQNIDAEFELATYQDLTAILPNAPRFVRLHILKPN